MSPWWFLGAFFGGAGIVFIAVLIGEAMREYRGLDTAWPGSPWASDEIGVLSTDFINWYRWERL